MRHTEQRTLLTCGSRFDRGMRRGYTDGSRRPTDGAPPLLALRAAARVLEAALDAALAGATLVAPLVGNPAVGALCPSNHLGNAAGGVRREHTAIFTPRTLRCGVAVLELGVTGLGGWCSVVVGMERWLGAEDCCRGKEVGTSWAA